MWANISIDVSEVYDELSDREKYTLLEWLEDDGITNYSDDNNPMTSSPMREEWSNTCVKLSHLYYQMTNEEQEIIEKIVKKYA